MFAKIRAVTYPACSSVCLSSGNDGIEQIGGVKIEAMTVAKGLYFRFDA
jgi:hypothetical protein